MVTACWSLKGGSGTSTVAGALAVLAAARHPAGALAIDVAGDLPALLGVNEDDVPGVTDWLLTEGALDPPGRGWTAPTIRCNDRLDLVPRGSGPHSGRRRAEMLAHLLAAEPREVVIDCGTLGVTSLDQEVLTVGHILARRADRSLLVTRACTLALRRLPATPLPINGVILVDEPGRTLLGDKLGHTVGAPVLAVVPHDPHIARAADAGTLAAEVPTALALALTDCL